MALPSERPTDPTWILDEIHRVEQVRDTAISDVAHLEVELTDETAKRVLHRVDTGSSVAEAERRVSAELTETRRRYLTARATVDRCTFRIEHYRFLLAHL
jgi:hypothetical protein